MTVISAYSHDRPVASISRYASVGTYIPLGCLDEATRVGIVLLLYSKTLFPMLQIDPSQVTLQLLFTCAGKVYRL